MAEPAVKGVLMQGVIERINAHVERGTIDRDALEARLEKADLDMLDRKVVSAVWYPIAGYRRLVDLVVDLEGGLSDEDHIRAGEADARRMMESGVYQQFELFQRLDSGLEDASFAQRFQGLGRTLRLAISISKAVFNFSDWAVVPDPDHPRRYRVEVSDAALLPDTNVVGAVGFLNECCNASRPRNPIRWSVERPRADRVVYRMEVDYA